MCLNLPRNWHRRCALTEEKKATVVSFEQFVQLETRQPTQRVPAFGLVSKYELNRRTRHLVPVAGKCREPYREDEWRPSKVDAVKWDANRCDLCASGRDLMLTMIEMTS